MSGRARVAPRRLGIVGGGPRALWALERLAAVGDPDLVVEVLSRDGRVGPGSAYDPAQPDWLRLNVASTSVDAWQVGPAGPGPREESAGESFDAWRERRDPGSTRDRFPPRALAGAYLVEQAAAVLARLGDRAVVRRCEVRDLARDADGRWVAHTCDGADPAAYDEVLLVTGHEADWPGALRHGWDGPVPLHPSAYPAEELLARDELRPGTTVVVRGAALTGTDAALTLARSDASRIVLTSRTGRLMHPKTEPEVLAALVDVDDATARAAELADRGVPVCDVVRRVARTLPGGTGRRLAGADAVGELRCRLAIATGAAEPDADWALGQAFRLAYPALVRRQARTDPCRPTLGEPDWAAIAARAERLAFGPPPVNARALLDLADAGVLEVRRGDAHAAAVEVDAALVVDAVLAPPGVRALASGGLLDRLVGRGLVVAAPHGRGAMVDRRCRVLDARGVPVPGLAMAGRATEDVVLGTDTLVRPLHPQLEEWARHA